MDTTGEACIKFLVLSKAASMKSDADFRYELISLMFWHLYSYSYWSEYIEWCVAHDIRVTDIEAKMDRESLWIAHLVVSENARRYIAWLFQYHSDTLVNFMDTVLSTDWVISARMLGMYTMVKALFEG